MPGIRYEFRDDTTPLGFANADKADAQVIGETLTSIADNHAGRLKPEDVLAAAAARKHALHAFFTWNDKDAAKKHRLNEARALIRSVEVVEHDAPNQERRHAFLSITDNQGRAYRAVQVVMMDPYLQTRLMGQVIVELRSMRRRYRDLSDICVLIEVAIGAAEELMIREAPAAA
jgi:hypothetical protein